MKDLNFNIVGPLNYKETYGKPKILLLDSGEISCQLNILEEIIHIDVIQNIHVDMDFKSYHLVILDCDYFDSKDPLFINNISMSISHCKTKPSVILIASNKNFNEIFKLFDRSNIFIKPFENMQLVKTIIDLLFLEGKGLKKEAFVLIEWVVNIIYEFQKKIQNNACKIISYYDEVITHIPGHIYWLDKNNVYLGCNSSQAKQANLLSPNEIVGKKNSDLPWKKQAHKLDELNSFVMSTGTAFTEEEYAVTASGPRYYLSQKIPLKDHLDDVVGVLGISLDISKQKKLENELKISQELSSKANKAKSEYIANISHDIRQPLSGIIGISELILQTETGQDEQFKKYINWIRQSSIGLIGLLDGAIESSSSEKNCSDGYVANVIFDIKVSIKEIIDVYRPTMYLKSLNIISEVDDSIPGLLWGDEKKITRILLNFISNAIKYTPNNGVIKVVVTNINQDESTTRIKFCIEDSGVGISANIIDRVLERFYKASPHDDKNIVSYGLGLDIANKYIKLLGGDLNIESQVGIGTLITFIIDLKPPPNYVKNSNYIETSKKLFDIDISKDIKKINKTPKILVVDDNFLALHLAKRCLEQYGCEFKTSSDGLDALLLAEDILFDLIITDIELPKMSGIELTSLIQKSNKINTQNQPIIIGITAHKSDEIIQRAITSGMKFVLEKPLNSEKLREILEFFGFSHIN